MEELLRAPSEFKVQVTVRRLEPSTDGDFRPILKEVKKRGEAKIIIDCDVDLVGKILSQAQSINMMTQYYHYLVTTLVSLISPLMKPLTLYCVFGMTVALQEKF